MQNNSLFDSLVPPFLRSLRALDAILDKAGAHAEARKTAWATFESALLGDKLIFDQFDFKKQVQIVCDNAKGITARMAEVEIPKHEDTELTIPELKERIKKTVAFLETLKPEQFENKMDIKVVLPYFNGKHMTGHDYVYLYAIPNFYFHLATAYSILRKNGVELGKSDYLGGYPLAD